MLKQYDRINAVKYALKWATSFNPNFYNFDTIGGDCTNFVSQCLLAGGGVMNYNKLNGWYYISIKDRSPSWTGVSPFMQFLLRKNKSVGPIGEITTLQEIELGDIIQLRQNDSHFNHSLFVTEKVGNKIYVSAHTFNVRNKPLDDYSYFDIMPIHIKGTLI